MKSRFHWWSVLTVVLCVFQFLFLFLSAEHSHFNSYVKCFLCILWYFICRAPLNAASVCLNWQMSCLLAYFVFAACSQNRVWVFACSVHLCYLKKQCIGLSQPLYTPKHLYVKYGVNMATMTSMLNFKIPVIIGNGYSSLLIFLSFKWNSLSSLF